MKNLFKKVFKTFSSRLLYLIVGLSFAVAIIIVQAAISSTNVTGGTPLTSVRWNTMVADLGSLDTRVGAVEGGSLVNVYKCPDDAPGCGGGSWTYSTCAGQITTNTTCTRVTWNGGANTCTFACAFFGRLRIY